MFPASQKLIKAGFAALALSLSTLSPATANQVQFLGEQRVGRNPDFDTFQIGPEAGRFDALQFRVLGNRVALADVKVHYLNGTSEHLNVQEHINPGTTTAAYDLRGDHRRIARVDVLYQTENRYGPQATVQLFGVRYHGGSSTGGNPGPFPPQPAPGRWEALGTQPVSLAVDHDTFQVGAGRGRFRMIKLEVHDRPIHLYNLRVMFRNGETQEFSINGLIPAGGSTQALDLNGDRRTIERVDLVYRTEAQYGRRGWFGRHGLHHQQAQYGLQARVTVHGLH